MYTFIDNFNFWMITLIVIANAPKPAQNLENGCEETSKSKCDVIAHVCPKVKWSLT